MQAFFFLWVWHELLEYPLSEYFFIMWETSVALSFFVSPSFPTQSPSPAQMSPAQPWSGFHSWLGSSDHRFLCGLPLFPFIPPSSLPSLFSSLPLFSSSSFFFNSAFSHYSPTCFRRREHAKGELSFPQAFFHAFAHSERLHPRLQFVLPVHLSFQPMRKEPEVVTVTLKKHNGMGLSIVAAKVGNVTWKFVKEWKSNFGSSEMFSVCWGLFIF